MRPAAAARRVRTALASLGLLAVVLGALWVAAPSSPPARAHDAVVTASSALPTARPGRAPALAAVLIALAAFAVLSWQRLGRRPALRPIPVPVRTARGRGPPRSTSI